MTEVQHLPISDRVASATTTWRLAYASYRIWRFYRDIETRDRVTMDRFSGFYLWDEEAHRRTMIVSLYTLFDTIGRDDVITLNKMILELASYDPDKAKPIEQRWRSVHHDIRKKVEIIRHNSFAHRNAVKTTNEVFAEANLTADQIKLLLDDARDILKMLASAVGAQEPVQPVAVLEHTRNILRALKTLG